MLPASIFALMIFASMGMASFVDPVLEEEEENPEIPPIEPPVDVPPVEPPVDDGPIGVTGGENFVGTGGADTFVNADSDTFVDGVSIAAGGGDDIINLATDLNDNPTREFSIENLTIDAGAGNDTITVLGDRLQIEGGSGDDTIMALFPSTGNIFGGEGNDTLTGEQGSSDPLNLFGGAGDDILDGSTIDNGALDGGEGNDDITMSGGADGGAGYVSNAFGGDGNDTMRYQGGGLNFEQLVPNTLTGGAGDDTFSLILNEGGDIVGDFAPTAMDGTQQLQSVAIADFNSDEDVIIVDASASSADYTLTGATLETRTDGADTTQTVLILRYESGTLQAREVVVGLGSADVALGDIAFVGEQLPMTFTHVRGVV